eukprot:6950994-Prorocentrum_lima.AAC.1
MQREVYFRPPPEGLPGLPAGSLLKARKGLFGIPEAPRLWYLELTEKAKGVGLTGPDKPVSYDTPRSQRLLRRPSHSTRRR